jgi:regulator of cell morphogenesis and NO signaling
MRSEHADYVGELEKMRELAHGFIPPEGAFESWERLYQGAALLDATLREQIRLENEVLFPRFEVAQTRCTCAHA